MRVIKDALCAGAIGVLLIILFPIDSDRDIITNNCLELGNSESQCEKLFE